MDRLVAVIGAGAWGTTLALILSRKGCPVRLWEYFPDYARKLAETRENPKFLPGVHIPENITISADIEKTAADCREIVLAVPAQKLRAVAKRLAGSGFKPLRVITASKGIERGSLARMSEVVRQEFGPGPEVCVLSGPSHAEEVSRAMPCSLVAASENEKNAQTVQELFSTENLRVYTSLDVVGVELGGALKNVIALAVGMVDGLGLGDNSKAALITRGLAEIGRLGKSLGANPETFAGLSGIGDLIVTCTSLHSRNRRVGEEIGRGRQLDEILEGMEMVAEGVETARSAKQLGERMKVEMPITFQINRILFEDIPPLEAVRDLMRRPRKAE
ncbi:NAD(P)-dependent glycerol-3-phosphate dehydrogenase [bacterium]|nr:NAD(P)-dependent glycerol-3-phosphate dehydrogenase [bacterium]